MGNSGEGGEKSTCIRDESLELRLAFVPAWGFPGRRTSSSIAFFMQYMPLTFYLTIMLLVICSLLI